MSGPRFIKIQSEINRLLARSFFYQLLAFLFKHPHAEEVRAYFSNNRSGWEKMFLFLNFPDKPRYANLLGSLFRRVLAIDQEEWIAEYEHCFGYTAYARVPAYELEYGEEHSHRQPQELADITAFYRAFGLQVKGKSHERVDHASVECEFLYFLLYKQAYALLYDGEDQAAICHEGVRRFLADHLGRWLPSFAIRLSKHATGGLMKEAAEFALGFVCLDCKTMEVQSGPRDLPIRAIQEMEESGCVSCSLGLGLDDSRSGKEGRMHEKNEPTHPV